MTQENKLLPIGVRVTHFDGGPHSHGKGTIVAYNNVPDNKYFNEKPQDAITLAAQAGLIQGLVNSLYNGERCPYVVHWDPREKYPEGYKDVYEPTSVREYKPVPDDHLFPHVASIRNTMKSDKEPRETIPLYEILDNKTVVWSLTIDQDLADNALWVFIANYRERMQAFRNKFK